MDIQLTYLCCNFEKETMEHILFQCPRARNAWSLAGMYVQVVQAKVPTEVFLELLEHSFGGRIPRAVGIRAAYVALHIWLARNGLVFESMQSSVRFAMERALTMAAEMIGATSRLLDIWSSHLAYTATHQVFISWEPPPLSYLRVNFDGSIRGRHGETGFVIRGLDSRLIVAGGTYLLEPMIPKAKYRTAWARMLGGFWELVR
ncbi:uncharacterized protein [Elaeis guineensis]|uniref:Uncharacterized protein LOC109504897 n=1 Tax=Elaeis guineensis var. tenera TaxID=51953 RepID=A0A6J0PCV9_ELAGV|nr:uncharacterized protein LOC109504897 [Elaeis guineensis]